MPPKSGDPETKALHAQRQMTYQDTLEDLFAPGQRVSKELREMVSERFRAGLTGGFIDRLPKGKLRRYVMVARLRAFVGPEPDWNNLRTDVLDVADGPNKKTVANCRREIREKKAAEGALAKEVSSTGVVVRGERRHITPSIRETSAMRSGGTASSDTRRPVASRRPPPRR